MVSSQKFLIVFLAATVLGGCHSTSDEQEKAEKTRREAEQKAAQFKSDLDKKLGEVGEKAEAEADAMKRKAAEKIQTATSAAREKTAEAQVELKKTSAEVRASTAKTLEGFDKDMRDLRVKLEKKLTKAEANRVMKGLEDKAEAVRKSVGELDNATGDKWEAAKRAVTQRTEELGRAIEEARKR
jgi:hypothetical protein